MQKSESKILYDQIIKLLKTTRNIGETVEKERAEYTALREKYGKLYLEKHDEMMEEGLKDVRAKKITGQDLNGRIEALNAKYFGPLVISNPDKRIVEIVANTMNQVNERDEIEVINKATPEQINFFDTLFKNQPITLSAAKGRLRTSGEHAYPRDTLGLAHQKYIQDALLAHEGLNINAKNGVGFTALEILIIRGDSPDFVQLFIDKGAQIPNIDRTNAILDLTYDMMRPVICMLSCGSELVDIEDDDDRRYTNVGEPLSFCTKEQCKRGQVGLATIELEKAFHQNRKDIVGVLKRERDKHLDLKDEVKNYSSRLEIDRISDGDVSMQNVKKLHKEASKTATTNHLLVQSCTI